MSSASDRVNPFARIVRPPFVSIITSQNTNPAERETQPIAPKRSLTSSYPISFFLR